MKTTTLDTPVATGPLANPVSEPARPEAAEGNGIRPTDGSAMPQLTLVHVHPATLDGVVSDLRDRTDRGYREFFERLVADIRERGVQVPLLAVRRGSRLEVVDGETRRLAALLAGVESVPVAVCEHEPKGAAKELSALQANAMRHDLRDMEYAGIYMKLMDENGWGQTELARRISANPTVVSKRLAVFSKLPDDLKGIIGEGDGSIPFTSAYQLARLADEAAIRDLAAKIQQGHLRRDSVADEVAKRLGKKSKRQKTVKAKTANGIQAAIPELDYDTVLADLAALLDAVKKCRHHGLPLSAVPGLLKP